MRDKKIVLKKINSPKTILLKPDAKKLLGLLHKLYPDAKTELGFGTAFELLIATMLSAQATDVSVNLATPALFKKFPDAGSMAAATAQQVEPYIRSIGLYRTKARNLVAASKILMRDHNGQVPNNPVLLELLPGVGKKTVSVVLSNAYGRPAIAVDTHVGRLARRLGLSSHTNPDKVQQDLENYFAKKDWIYLHHALILHGRRVCKARAPNCQNCSLAGLCPKIGV